MDRKPQVALGLTLLLLLSGCGGGAGPDNRPERVAVSGIITLDGTPVDGATIVFRSSRKSPGATAKSGADGKFTMTTYVAGDGCVPGSYNVGVSKMVGPAISTISEDDPNYDGEASDEFDVDEEGESRFKAEVPKNTLPEVYADPDNGLLSVQISEATADVKIELSSDAE